MNYRNCGNCKKAIRLNTYFETINGKLEPLNDINDFFIAYCPRLDDNVLKDDFCTECELVFEPVKVKYVE